jgi:hypothetical protein
MRKGFTSVELLVVLGFIVGVGAFLLSIPASTSAPNAPIEILSWCSIGGFCLAGIVAGVQWVVRRIAARRTRRTAGQILRAAGLKPVIPMDDSGC